MASDVLDSIVIGGGPGGMTAAIYCGVYKMKHLVLAKSFGMLADSHEIWNFPSYPSIKGLELVKKMRSHAAGNFGSKIVDDEAVNVKRQKDGVFCVETASKKKYLSRTLIIATGLTNRKLGIGEEKYVGKGVSYCFTCDSVFFKDKNVGVIGGSDSAAQAALLLSEYAKKVFIIYRRDALRCQPVYIPKIKSRKNIKVIYNSNVKKLFGEKMLEKVLVSGGEGKDTEMPLDGLFVEIGAVPQSIVFRDLGLKFNEAGFIEVDCWQKTSVDGVYAVGDITATHPGLKQAVIACGEGAVAGNSAFRFAKHS